MRPTPLTLALLAASSFLRTPVLAQSPAVRVARPSAWGDLDGDGRCDLWVADATGDRALICRPDGGFDERQDLVAPGVRSSAALLLDLDGNEREDLLLLGTDGGLRLWLGGPDGLVERGDAAGLTGLPAGVALAAIDYDADGRPDLSLTSSEVEILLHNEGRGRFAKTLELPRVAGTAAFLAAPSVSLRSEPSNDEESSSGPAGPGSAGSGGGQTNGPGGPGVGISPGGPSGPRGAGHICAGTIEDFAVSGVCLAASSVPTLGMLYPLGTELFIDSVTGFVGIGTTSPLSTLDVAGTLRTEGFEMPTGAGAGKILASDEFGVAGWAPPVDNGNTLDEAYDQGNPGAGRKIIADSGEVRIEATGNDALYLKTDGSSDGLEVDVTSDPGGTGIRLKASGAGDGLRAEYAGSKTGVNVITTNAGSTAIAADVTDATNPNPAVEVEHAGTGSGVDVWLKKPGSAASAVDVTQAGLGRGIEVDLTNAANGASGLDVDQAGIGRGILAALTNAANAAPGVDVQHAGTGPGVEAFLSNAASTAPAISGVTAGSAHGVYGKMGADPVKGNVVTEAGVAGEAKDRIGVAGWSDTSTGVQGKSEDGDGVQGFSKNLDGVYGTMEKTGTWTAGGINGQPVIGGVKGISADVDTFDNFGVIGDARGYGIGVLGLGGADEGHGVVGVSAQPADGDKTITGVRGVTREPGNTHWDMRDLTGKVKVGVYGQAKAYAGVWGESTERVGVAGTGGVQAPNGNLPTDFVGVYGQVESKVADPTQPTTAGVIGTADTRPGVSGWSRAVTGVRGLSKEEFGVRGESRSGDPAAAGLSGVGMAGAGAAALNVHEGAISVSGAVRPAGTVAVGDGWAPVSTCEGGCVDCPHAHLMGWKTIVDVDHILCKDDSIILLTVEGNSLGEGFNAHVATKVDGSFAVMVTSIGDPNGQCQQPIGSLKVHYLIIDPI